MSYFIRNGNKFSVSSSDSLDIYNDLPVNNYVLKYDRMQETFFLEIIDSFIPNSKYYGDTLKTVERIMNTFEARSVSTGVMLTGEKGSGKTLLAKTLSIACSKRNCPTIVINEPFNGDAFNKFIQDIEQPCLILFDEFEKVYDDKQQSAALTLLDGVFPTKKLFVITCNDKWKVNEHMRNRPGRIFYLLEYNGVSVDFIEEYCNDNLINKTHINELSHVLLLFENFNFDMLKAIVEEMNRYDESPKEALRYLNIKPESSDRTEYLIEFMKDSYIFSRENDNIERYWVGNPLSKKIEIEWTNSKGHWESTFFDAQNIKTIDKNGDYIFENADGFMLSLKRINKDEFNYLNLAF